MNTRIFAVLWTGISFFLSTFFYSETVYAKIRAQHDLAYVQQEPAPVKEWTFLIFLNGKNNLDSYGAKDINEMEKIGSTAQINVVVQWGSLLNGSTRRLLIQKDDNLEHVTSPVIQDLGKVDMGDWKNLVDFVRWAVSHYPAKHYFIDVWDHGSGWHFKRLNLDPKNISWDNETGNFMTTQQLGQALMESSNVIGHKVDLYGSDACLMAMAEVAAEMTRAVEISVGSEEVEPGDGWPYDTFLEKWAGFPEATAKEVAQILTEEYVKSYQGGSQGRREVTFSAFDLSKIEPLNNAIKLLSELILKLDFDGRTKVLRAADRAVSFTYGDYVDILDWIQQIKKENIFSDSQDVWSQVKAVVSEFVIANQTTPYYTNALGLSFWLPTDSYSYHHYADVYQTMSFHVETRWGDALKHLLQDAEDW